jgi:HAD superfamily hydrolase (TIGR01509 family)
MVSFIHNERYAAGPPWLPGAIEAVQRIAAVSPLGLASSSNRELIDLVLDAGGIAELFQATVSSEEVARGKPSPDVYLEAARRLDIAPSRCVAVEDSGNGISAAHAAGMAVIAFPNAFYPPADDTLALAAAVIGSLDEPDLKLLGQLTDEDGYSLRR